MFCVRQPVHRREKAKFSKVKDGGAHPAPPSFISGQIIYSPILYREKLTARPA
jgi:hypothetical protein